MKAFLLLLLLAVSAAKGEEGVSYLAFAGFDSKECAKALRVWDGVEFAWVAFLWSSFGDGLCPDIFISNVKSRRKRVQIYASNGTCRRFPRYCTRFDVPASYASRLERIADWIYSRYGEAEFHVVIELEDDISTKEFRRRLKLARKILPPGTKIIRNPNARNFDSHGADIIELHGLERADFPAGAGSVVSNDGVDIDFGSARRECKGAVSASRLRGSILSARKDGSNYLIWWNTQGACTGKFVEPRRRSFGLRSKDVRSVNKILRRHAK